MLFVGLDIGGTNIKAGVLDGSTGHLVGSAVQEPLPKERSPEVCLENGRVRDRGCTCNSRDCCIRGSGMLPSLCARACSPFCVLFVS